MKLTFKNIKIFKNTIISLIFVITSQCTFIELRLYPPKPFKTYKPSNKNLNIVWKDETNLGMSLGYHSPFIFAPRLLPNRYGSLIDILKRELDSNWEEYPVVREGKLKEIQILEFQLKTKDTCFENKTSVLMVSEWIATNKTYYFHYYKEIFSHVTDCFLIGSAILAIPLVVYTPYVGFRGNREDQLNQLGRNVIRQFLKELKEFQP